MPSFRSDLTASRVYPFPSPESTIETDHFDHFDRLPDSLLLLIFNNIGDVKSLGRCSVVSRRFHSLVPQVQSVVVKVDCVISDDDVSSSSSSSADKASSHIANLVRIIFGNIFKPLKALTQFLRPKRCSSSSAGNGEQGGGVAHHSPTQVLKNFDEIRFLKIELPAGELGIDEGVLLKWRADFGSTLDNCVILGASSVIYLPKEAGIGNLGESSFNNMGEVVVGGNVDDNGSIPESLSMNGGLKLRVVWTISSLIAASARHYLLQPIIAEHQTLDSLVLTDSDGQGLLCMNRDQLEELRVKPLSASSASKRTLVPALNMRLWYAPHLELPNGVILKGATLVDIKPTDQSGAKKETLDLSWVSTAFEEPYGTAAKMLIKRRTYCLEMNSF